MAGQMVVAMPSTNIKAEIAKILKEEGYIDSFEVADGDAEHPAHKTLRVRLKYVGERRRKRPVITGLERVSRPGRRVYTHKTGYPVGPRRDGCCHPVYPQRGHDGTARSPAWGWWRNHLQGLVGSCRAKEVSTVSRIGRMPVAVPAGVQVKITGHECAGERSERRAGTHVFSGHRHRARRRTDHRHSGAPKRQPTAPCTELPGRSIKIW